VVVVVIVVIVVVVVISKTNMFQRNDRIVVDIIDIGWPGRSDGGNFIDSTRSILEILCCPIRTDDVFIHFGYSEKKVMIRPIQLLIDQYYLIY
jgi:hypothetical protein